MPLSLSLPSTLVGPKWDAAKSKWKWVLTADYSQLAHPPYVYAMNVTASVGENASEPRYALLPCPPTPYTIWIPPISSSDGVAAYVGGLSANVENSRGDIYSTAEYDLVAPCMVVELERIFQYHEGMWSIMVSASIFGGTGPFSYSWSPSGAKAGGKTTDSFVRFELDRSVPLSISLGVTYTTGCSASAYITVTSTEMKNLVPPDWSYEDEICSDGYV